jgi:transcriptional regulator with XRE-family HTH domain
MTEEPIYRTAMSINSELFGTDDPELMRLMFKRSCQVAREREDSFGGYLRSIRRLRGLRVQDMAALAGVAESRWDLWEVNAQTPSTREFEQVMDRLEFSPYKRERLAGFLEQAPRHALRDLSRSRLHSVAAHGKAVVDAKLEWEALGPQARAKLKGWAATRELEFPRELLTFVGNLDDVEGWIDEVFGEEPHVL